MGWKGRGAATYIDGQVIVIELLEDVELEHQLVISVIAVLCKTSLGARC